MKHNYEIKKADYCNTGGGIYVFIGELTDGNYFLADSDEFCVRILNDSISWENDDAFYSEWQEERLVEDLDTLERLDFFENLIEYLRKNADYFDPVLDKFLGCISWEKEMLSMKRNLEEIARRFEGDSQKYFDTDKEEVFEDFKISYRGIEVTFPLYLAGFNNSVTYLIENLMEEIDENLE